MRELNLSNNPTTSNLYIVVSLAFDCFPTIWSHIPWASMDLLCRIDFHRHRFALASIDCHRLLVPIMIFLSFSLVCMHVHRLLMICIGFHWGSLILNASKGFIDFYWFTWIVIHFHSFHWFHCVHEFLSIFIDCIDHLFSIAFHRCWCSFVFHWCSLIFVDCSLMFIDFHWLFIDVHWFS